MSFKLGTCTSPLVIIESYLPSTPNLPLPPPSQLKCIPLELSIKDEPVQPKELLEYSRETFYFHLHQFPIEIDLSEKAYKYLKYLDEKFLKMEDIVEISTAHTNTESFRFSLFTHFHNDKKISIANAWYNSKDSKNFDLEVYSIPQNSFKKFIPGNNIPKLLVHYPSKNNKYGYYALGNSDCIFGTLLWPKEKLQDSVLKYLYGKITWHPHNKFLSREFVSEQVIFSPSLEKIIFKIDINITENPIEWDIQATPVHKKPERNQAVELLVPPTLSTPLNQLPNQSQVVKRLWETQ